MAERVDIADYLTKNAVLCLSNYSNFQTEKIKARKVLVEKFWWPEIDSLWVFLAANQKCVPRNRIPGNLFSGGQGAKKC